MVQGPESTVADSGAERPLAGATTLVVPPELRALNSAFATLTLDHEGRVQRANNHFLRAYGYDLDELKGRDFIAISPADGMAASPEAVWCALLDGEQRVVERMRVHKDGSRHWIQAFYTPLRHSDGSVRQVVEISIDISSRVQKDADDHGQIAAINASSAVVHFSLDGLVLDANARFLDTMGYRLDEVEGRHHRLFIDADHAASDDYAAFWAALAQGNHHSGEYSRRAKDGREVWWQATYTPILDRTGRVQKVVKYAIDLTRERLALADFQWQIDAIRKSRCVITFDLHGVVLDANDNFLEAMGYAQDEVLGRHHRMFVEASHAHSAEYAAFWRNLQAGRHQSGQYRRVGEGGREVWLQADYSPVFDMSGRLNKIVKYASVVTEEKRRQAEHQGQIAAIHKAQCVVSFDLDGCVVDANDNFLDSLGYRLPEVRGQHHRMFVEPEQAQSAEYQDFWDELRKGAYQAGEFKRIGKDGREVWLQATYNPILGSNGKPTQIVKYATDITQQKLRQADFQSQIEAIHKSQGVITFGLDGTILDANDNFLDTLGYRLDEIAGRHHRVLLEPGAAEMDEYHQFWDTLRTGTFVTGRHKRIGKDGRTLWLQASYNPVFDLNGQLTRIIKFASDITADVALAEAFEDAQRQAQHDPATSLPNRTRLASFMASALSHSAARLVVFYLDLDRFKPINDTYGHAIGDRVLGEIADRLRRSLKGDQIAARIGGDEFVIAAPHLTDEEAEAYCQRLVEAISEPMRHEVGDLTVGVSIGIAVSPADGKTPDELLRSADTALYRAKHDGRGAYCFFSDALNDRVSANRRMVEEMRRGIAAGEFYVDFQPRFDSRTQTMRSAEALVRWAHPERGRLGPDLFIPLAEKSGLIVPLGDWVLQTACKAAAQWPDIGVSVNVSPVQFRDGRLAQRVKEVLESVGLAPDRLEIEITEGVLMADADGARTVLRDLKALGVKLAIDDFGTGYASLSSLRSFPFDVIKIDRQFIADLDRRDGSRDIVKAILALGTALGLSVTAEGVETEEQLRALIEDQCGEVQGFLLGRPMSAPKLVEMFDPVD
jgi:diguanylate cyclase (GGDEF)-like protein/PAS domain S-box-containing protein